jgi:hypothetical protein
MVFLIILAARRSAAVASSIEPMSKPGRPALKRGGPGSVMLVCYRLNRLVWLAMRWRLRFFSRRRRFTLTAP